MTHPADLDTDSILAKMREIALATFGMELPSADSPIKAAGLDSLALIDIVMGLEDHYGCQLPLESLPPNPTVGDFVSLVQAHSTA